MMNRELWFLLALLLIVFGFIGFSQSNQERYKVLTLENRPAALKDLETYLNGFGKDYRLVSTIQEPAGYGFQPQVHLIFERK